MATEMKVSALESQVPRQARRGQGPGQSERVQVVRLKDFTIGRFKLQPGWRWSECIKPVVHTESCRWPMSATRSPDASESG